MAVRTKKSAIRGGEGETWNGLSAEGKLVSIHSGLNSRSLEVMALHEGDITQPLKEWALEPGRQRACFEKKTRNGTRTSNLQRW
jgi:hypothetical protein